MDLADLRNLAAGATVKGQSSELVPEPEVEALASEADAEALAQFEPDNPDKFTPWCWLKPWPETLAQCVEPEFLPKVLDIFRYDPETGFVWSKHDPPGHPHSRMTTISNRTRHGRVSFYNLSVASAKLVWLIHHHRWPDCQLRHRDGDTSNDRIENLYELWADKRDASAVAGPRQRRNASRGVARCGPDHWQAYVRVNGRQKGLGRFRTEAEALAARAAWDRGDDLV